MSMVDRGMSVELLRAEGLSCERDDRMLFENLNFQVNAGEVVQIEGPNGAGKTTLLKILGGLLQAWDGELYWRGEPMTQARPDFLASLLYLGHRPGIKLILSPWENLRTWCALHQPSSDQELFAALAQVGLKGYEHVPCDSLSAGQQRRVALARLYLSKADLWVLDEAFTAIDRRGVAQLEALLAQKAAAGGAVILTTHHALNLPGALRVIRLGGSLAEAFES